LTTSQPEAPLRTGILLTNVGTPDAPTPTALRPYLKQFLSDPRVVDYPRWLWLPLLHGVILNTRPRRSARLYRNIWSEEGSPLLTILLRQAAGIELRTAGDASAVAVGLRYGNPSIASGLQSLRSAGCERILVFPLYPQYSATTTGTSLDAVFSEIRSWSRMPDLRTVNSYASEPDYIRALANSIRGFWETHAQPDRLLFSFHGIPKRYAENKGDPYPAECRETASLVAAELGLESGRWAISFQSRFGPEEWLKPYTDDLLREWGHAGVRSVHVIAAGFSADCLETVDELGREACETFEEAGGKDFHYIPALNDRPDHLDALAAIARKNLAGWID